MIPLLQQGPEDIAPRRHHRMRSRFGSVVRGVAMALALAGACSAAHTASAATAAPTDSAGVPLYHFEVLPAHPCQGDTVRLLLWTESCPPCEVIESFDLLSSSPTQAWIAYVPGCTRTICTPRHAAAIVGLLAAGHYHFNAQAAVRTL